MFYYWNTQKNYWDLGMSLFRVIQAKLQSQSIHQQTGWPWLFQINSPCICYCKRKERDDAHCFTGWGGGGYRWCKESWDVETFYTGQKPYRFKYQKADSVGSREFVASTHLEVGFGHSSIPCLKLYHQVFSLSFGPLVHWSHSFLL